MTLLDLVLHLTGGECGTSFLDQSQRAVRQTRCRASNDNFSKVLLGDHGKHKLQANKLTLGMIHTVLL